MNVEEYRSLVHEDIELVSKTEGTYEEDEFLRYAVDILIKGEEFDDFIECKYEGVTRRKGNMRIDGYARDDADGSCCVFITDYHGKYEDEAVKSEEINASFRKMRLFIEEAVRTELYSEMRGSTASVDFARDLYYDSESITKYRFYLLTDAYNKQRAKTIKDDSIGEKTVELNVWDISRLYELVCSRAQKESIEIIISDFGIKGIPCVKAVDYENVIADIEAPFKSDDDTADDEDKPYNVVTYKSYLAVVPGEILNTLYLEYGSKLLEGNVRSFLSVRGKVNKSIQVGDRLITVEEYIKGHNLKEIIEQDGTFDEDEMLHVALQLCDILEALHSMNPPMIHRDVKPTNIMLKKTGEVVLIDYNASRERKEGYSQDTVLFGTQNFAAPEQLMGFGDSDARTDVFGLGATLSFLMTNMPINQMVAPGKYSNILKKCISMDKKDRYQTIAELREALISA